MRRKTGQSFPPARSAFSGQDCLQHGGALLNPPRLLRKALAGLGGAGSFRRASGWAASGGRVPRLCSTRWTFRARTKRLMLRLASSSRQVTCQTHEPAVSRTKDQKAWSGATHGRPVGKSPCHLQGFGSLAKGTESTPRLYAFCTCVSASLCLCFPPAPQGLHVDQM